MHSPGKVNKEMVGEEKGGGGARKFNKGPAVHPDMDKDVSSHIGHATRLSEYPLHSGGFPHLHTDPAIKPGDGLMPCDGLSIFYQAFIRCRVPGDTWLNLRSI